ncbi:ROK family transcriptional regulator [Plantibacter sp. ME-Dv--P-095]|uniref:ROK family transcriptional regulator n=1 Tax=Plantibacter sp. ME-Dv--P-095 TaxID=3040299 RepID=UPI002549E58E|nr:ROK family transcriptional regulator [Plantibacter sp. ME-Dv--P-095]
MTETRLSTNAPHRWPHLADAERGALRELLIHGPLPRAEIARRLDVSRASLTRATRVLMEQAMVTEGETALRGAMGRPSEMLVVRGDAHHFLGVKLTGDAVFAVVTDLSAQIVASAEEPLVSTSVSDTVDQIGRLYDRFAVEFDDIRAAGICLAGDLARIDGRQIVLASYFLKWRDVPLAELLGQRLGIPVTADNDVHALTASQHWFGAGAGSDSLALITIGAGIGFGLIVDGRVVTGHSGRAGRFDHLIVDSTGSTCGLGHHGCASVYLTSESIVRAVGREDVDYAGAVSLARAGDATALRAFESAGRALGVIIGTIINGLDPERVVLTGDGLAVLEIAGPEVRRTIEAIRLPNDAPARLEVLPFEFTEWARAGAVAAIRTILRF